MRERVESDGDLGPADVGFSLTVGRSVFERRAVVVGGDRVGLLAGVHDLARGVPAPGLVEGLADVAAGEGIVFLFPGQGSQWVGMAVGLLDSSPAFAEWVPFMR